MTEKTGAKALIAMKELDNSVVLFKKPTIPRTKKGQMRILTEEQYIEARHSLSFFIFNF